MPHPHSQPTRYLPEKPNFAQLRTQAKELLKSYQAGEREAVAEVERFERSPAPSSFALADAQRVVARSYGFASWTKLKQHVDGANVITFCQAVDARDIATVRRLAKSRSELVNIARGDDFGERIALHFAVLNRDAEMTRVLMELGSNSRKGVWPHRDATSAYTIASERGYDEIVAIIEQQEVQRRQERSVSGATISSATDEIRNAILASRYDEAMRILESDLSLVGACDDRGATPLHIAAGTHTPEMVAWLLDHGAPVNARAAFDVSPHFHQVKEGSGRTPLDYAAIIAGWSAHGRDFCFLENSRIEPARFHETVRLLRRKGAELTPRAAVAIGDRQAVLQMHRAGRLENEIHFFRGGLLSIAVRVNRIEMVAILLDLGLDRDEFVMSEEGDRSWGMPLWFATMCGRHEVAELLLDRGADVDAIVNACGDALSIAGTTQDENMKTLLLARGARITVEHVSGAKDRETAKAILAGAIPAQSLNVSEPSHTELAEQMLWAAGGSDPEIVRMCLPHMTKPRNDPWWNYVLMHATLLESFKLILEHGVDPDVASGDGRTTLHHLAAVDRMKQEGLIFATMLLDAGASLTRRDALLQSTPLGWACRWGRSELAKLYLERGADAVESSAEPWATPLAWAAKGGHREIVELLRTHGAT
jgi:ankyrin repeat protein